MKAFFYESNFLLSAFVYCNVYDYDVERGDFLSLFVVCERIFICRRVEKLPSLWEASEYRAKAEEIIKKKCRCLFAKN